MACHPALAISRMSPLGVQLKDRSYLNAICKLSVVLQRVDIVLCTHNREEPLVVKELTTVLHRRFVILNTYIRVACFVLNRHYGKPIHYTQWMRISNYLRTNIDSSLRKYSITLNSLLKHSPHLQQTPIAL